MFTLNCQHARLTTCDSTLQQLLLQHTGKHHRASDCEPTMSTREFEETLSQLNIVSTIYWCNNEGGIMPSPDEVHQSTVERNIPRWWIAVTTGQHGGMANKDQRGIHVIPGAINLPSSNRVLISTSPFVAIVILESFYHKSPGSWN